MSTEATGSSPPSFAHDLRDAVMWLVATVPAAFGFWVIAGELAGVQSGIVPSLLGASLAAMGLATLVQVVAGYRLPLFEGPAGSYLAAIAVLAAGSEPGNSGTDHRGLLVAAGVVILVAVTGLGDKLSQLLTPPVGTAFLLLTVVMVLPATISRAAGVDQPGPAVDSWLPALVVIAVALVARRVAVVRPYALLLAFASGVLAYLITADTGLQRASSNSVPGELFPWGAPEFGATVVLPFVVASLLGAFNSVATERAVAGAAEPGEPVRQSAQPGDGSRQRRGLLAHGATVGVTAALGNVLGNVPRLDSVGIGRLVGNPGVRPVGLAAVAMVAMAFLAPVTALLAGLPSALSAALVLILLGTMLYEGLRATLRLPSSFAGRWCSPPYSQQRSGDWRVIGSPSGWHWSRIRCCWAPDCDRGRRCFTSSRAVPTSGRVVALSLLTNVR
ncbi:MAG: purine/pyrimidine permease [Nocardioidaceae bacterium]|nr:MAG: purine/pyrimidine permease [Nocardioidaceae bacterium]